ncbi:MAG: long-chain fatty acid--CoA ligase, partial [Variovorax sp.]
GWWHSGDLGRLDAQGFLQVLDRLKDVINRGGYKVFSVEVENVLSHHPAVLESAIVGKPCPVLGERVHAFVSVRAGALPSPDELRRYCAAQLADYKVPEAFTLVDEPLPRNANGKLLKRTLRDRLLVD